MPALRLWKAAFIVLLAASILLTTTPSAADDPEPGSGDRIVDDDGDGIFDDLEEELAPAPPGQPFDVIVLLEQPLSTATLGMLRQSVGDFDVDFEFPSVAGFAATLTKGQITALSQLGAVAQIEADRPATLFLDTASEWFGVNKAETDFGFDGNADGLSTYSTGDIVIAVLDTGIDDGHDDLASGKVLAWTDTSTPASGRCSTPCDPHGHGTHVSSIAAGTGSASGGTFKGAAAGAALVGVRVLNSSGSGSASTINAGIQWVIDNKATYNIRVLNMSLGFDGCFDDTHSVAQMVNSAAAAGIVAVVSAGNEGPGACTIGSPASASGAVTVGAMADPEHGSAVNFSCGGAPAGGFYLICFSSRGPTADGRIKPDVAGPGVLIRAADAGTTTGYVDASGTSMSSPFVAGVVADMLHASAGLSPGQIKTILMDTAVDWGTAGRDNDYGAGRLDAYEAIRAAAGASGTNISVPNHQLIWGDLPAGSGSTNCAVTNSFDDYTVNVSDPSQALAATLIMPTWGDGVDFDVCLFDKDGVQVGISSRDARQETVGIANASNGPYTLRIWAWPGGFGFPTSAPGQYFFDISVGGSISPPVSVALTTDGSTPFGSQGFNVTVDTTASGTNDVQTVQVATGPADLYVRTTAFSDSTNVWSLGSTPGADRVVWRFSTDGAAWTTFTQTDTLVPLDTGVPAGGNRNVYFQLTTPTSSSSTNQHTATVTIVAVAP